MRATADSRVVAAAILASMAATAASVSDVQAQAPPTRQETGASDFLPHRPWGAIGVRTGLQIASAGSDLYDFFEDQLTIERSDFNAVPFGVEFALPMSPRIQLVFGWDLARSSVASQYREWVDTTRQEITQDTSLSKASVTVGVKYAFVPRGVEVSALAWVPRTVVPYAGGSGGVMRYELKQHGSFVDFRDRAVYDDSYASMGWVPTVQAFGGADVRVFRMLYVNLEARYAWADADLDEDFVGFRPIDLSGITVSAGLSWVF